MSLRQLFSITKRVLQLSLGLCLFLTAEARANPKPHFSKVLVVVFENTDFDVAMKNPVLNRLTLQGVLLDHFSGVVHPSQGNYISMVAGSAFGIHHDNNIDLNKQHIGDQLEKAGMDWRLYAEDLPSPCFLGESKGKYYRKHVPFLSFTNVSKNPQRCANVVNADTLLSDLSSNSLANYTMIVPNIVNDGHDGGQAAIQRWSQKYLVPFLSIPKNLEDTLVVVTFDESDSYFSNRIYTVLLGAGLTPNTVNSQALTHTDILALIQNEWNLGHLPQQEPAIEIKNLWKN